MTSKVAGPSLLSPQSSANRFALLFLFALCVMLFGYHALVGLWQPILDMHGFRQSQTALSIYWIAHGGPWFAYETPVVGFPWAVPFEFPVYQLIVAPFVVLGVPVEVAGRLVSIGFFVGSLWPVRMLARSLDWPTSTPWVIAILILGSPLYIFWTRTVMIETTALFFGLLWLALLVQYMQHPSGKLLAGAVVAGCLCALTKVTTFPGFAIIGGLIFLYQAGLAWFDGALARRWFLLGGLVAIGLVPIIVTLLWTAWTDQIKMANELGRSLTSASLSGWMSGTWEQRVSKAFWWDVVMSRALPDTFGWVGMICAFAAAGIGLASSRFQWAGALAVIGFLTAFLIVTNLHAVHNYYQSANALFALAAAGFGIAALIEDRRWVLAYGLLGVILLSQFQYFSLNFKPAILADQSDNIQLRVATAVRLNTTPDQSLLVLGDDWSSAIPFYAERKSLAVAGWIAPELVRKILANPQTFLGDRPLGAVVYCPGNIKKYGVVAAEIDAFAARRAVIADLGWCKVLGSNPVTN